jgi:hypothetical protein
MHPFYYIYGKEIEKLRRLERAGAQCAPYNYVSEEKVRKKHNIKK